MVPRPRLRSFRPARRTSLRLCRDPSVGKFHVEHITRSRPASRPTLRRNTLCPSSSQNFRRSARHLSPVTPHLVGLRNDRPTPNDKPDRHLHCGGYLDPPPLHRSFDCSSGTYPLVVNRRRFGVRSRPQNKNGVFHVKHAARSSPTAPPIRPFSSPTRGRFRSHADSVRGRLPALPAQTRPSPARSRSRRSAAPPARSARSAASPHPYRATH